MNLPEARVLLINITGHDRPGVTHALTAVIARYDVRILDIGQALIHSAFAFGILVELTGQPQSSAMLAELNRKSSELGAEVRLTEVSADEYQIWVEGQRKRRYLITMLGRVIRAHHLAGVTGLIAQETLNIDSIDRLSGRTSLDVSDAASRMCIELAVSGKLDCEDRFRAALIALADEFDFDLAFQHDNIYRRNRRLVAFDMDSTLIATEVIDELAKLAGVGEQVVKITAAAMRGELDFKQSFRQRVSLLRGLPESELERVKNRIPLMDGADRLTQMLRRLGYKTAILSGGFTFIGRELQQRLGIDYLHANELEIRDGVVTGEVISEIVDGARKATLLEEIAAEQGLSMEQVIAVGDGANDLPMLRIAGLGIAFRAKPLVRQGAKQSISTLGLDGILYLLGLRDRETIP